MSLKRGTFDQPKAPIPGDGFEVLDACHRQTLDILAGLAGLTARLDADGPSAEDRAAAAQVVTFFSTIARQHHEDEERHVFPKMLASTDPEIVQTVLRLQQDHRWLEQDWMELKPMLQAVADGQRWYDPEAMREGVEIFLALSREHVELEESCIYPQARVRLRTSDRREMGREMAARRETQREAQRKGPRPA
jgi:hemerythrin-like domain-containing protein